jgi:hypothetical protein
VKKLIFMMTMLILISMAIHTVKAAPPRQVSGGEVYTVQAGDWLSKIAEKVYGDRLAYPGRPPTRLGLVCPAGDYSP